MLSQATIASPIRCAIPRNHQLLSRCTNSTSTRFVDSLKSQGLRPASTSFKATRSSSRVSLSSQQLAFASNTAAAPSQATSPTSSNVNLNWETFFRLRKVRRRFDIAGSIGSAVVFSAGGIVTILNDVTVLGYQLLTLDPIVLGVITFAFGALGWLVGPSIGNSVFNMFYKSYRPQMNAVSHYSDVTHISDTSISRKTKHYMRGSSIIESIHLLSHFKILCLISMESGYKVWMGTGNG
jgi:hypothetical protein